MLRVNHEDYDNWVVKDDRERIRIIKWICGKVCGQIAAAVFVHGLSALKPKAAPQGDLLKGLKSTS